MVAVLPNQLLVVDLSRQRISTEQLPARWVNDYLGGKGLGARYLYETTGPDTDPFDPENRLLLLIGPLTGYLPGDARVTAITKSPLTEMFLDSYIGGSFGRSLRSRLAGYVGIAIHGTTGSLQYLDLRSDEPQLCSANGLMDATVDQVDEHFPDSSVLATGPAGERGVRFATISTDGGDHHAGRGGSGAVMGKKGIKAIVVPTVAELEAPTKQLTSLQEATATKFGSSPYGASYQSSGTHESIEFADLTGILPSYAWQLRGFEPSHQLGLDAVRRAADGREYDDSAYPGDFRISNGASENIIRGGTPMALGSLLGISDFDEIARLGGVCDRLGLDVISASNAIGVAIRASQQGRIERKLGFGDTSAIESLLREIAYGSSELGKVLAAGVDRAGSQLGLAGEIPTVKAMALPSFDPRGAPALALAYATSDRGACHRRSTPVTVQVFTSDWTPTQTAQAIIAEQDRRAVLWNLIIDDLLTPVITDLGASWLDALGYDITTATLEEIGVRTWTTTRLFNVREGVTRDADTLPLAFCDSDGIDPIWFDRCLSRYYECREWDYCGRPSERLLERLDLMEMVDQKTPIGDHPLRQ